MDPRYEKLASTLCRYSMALKKGEKVLIDVADTPRDMVIALIREARKIGAVPFVNLVDSKISAELLRESVPAQFETAKKWLFPQMKNMDAYCVIRGAENMFEMANVPLKNYAQAAKIMKPIQNYRVNKTKWVLLRWPTPGFSQAAKCNTEEFENFFFDVCTLDYAKMKKASVPLEKLMLKTDKVRIVGPGDTDLSFSIKNIGAVKCVGERNIPDGEVYSCPVKDSVEGVIHYNTPTVYPTNGGKEYKNVRLEFKKGKIVKASCDSGDNRELNKIFDTDAGSRYVGEFAIGFNPYVKEAMCDILFDEKIAGSLHFTPGQCYEDASNGNNSSIHWDMVLIQRKEYGGGEIWFDDKLIRKDGIFVHPALKGLNPDAMLGKKPAKRKAPAKKKAIKTKK